jgi:hypothetical protein
VGREQWKALRVRTSARSREDLQEAPRRDRLRGDLYAISGADDETAKYLEGRFLNLVDSGAAKALDLLEAGRGALLDIRLRTAWSRFMMRLLRGSPEAVDRFSAQVKDMLAANFAHFADDKEHVARTTVVSLQTVMDSKLLGEQKLALVAHLRPPLADD